MNVTRVFCFTAAAFVLCGATLFADEWQAPPPPPPPEAPQVAVSSPARPVIDTLNLIAEMVTNLDDVSRKLQQRPVDSAEKPQARQIKNAMVMMTAGAAGGAVVGSAVSRDSRAALYGAIAGGVAGLVFDRVTQPPRQKPTF